MVPVGLDAWNDFLVIVAFVYLLFWDIFYLFLEGKEMVWIRFVFLPCIIFKHSTIIKALNLTIPLSEISMVFPMEWEHLLWRSCGEEKVLRMLTSSAGLRFSLYLRLSSLNTYPATIFRIRNAEGRPYGDPGNLVSNIPVSFSLVSLLTLASFWSL